MTIERVVEQAACLGCGCTCDDIDLVLRGERIVEARRACALGVSWFGDGAVPTRVRMSGQDATLDDALDGAARLLARAARPLIYLAPDVSCETQRQATALADALRASLDSVTSATAMDSIVAAQDRGRAGATLGEIRNRADVIVFWGVDPSVRYPRYAARYAPEPAGLLVPDGRRSRTVMAVDVGDCRGPGDADGRVTVSLQDEVATVMALEALLAADGTPLAAAAAARTPADRTSAAWARARELAPVIRAARYAVIVADAEPDLPRDPGRASALIALTQTANDITRCALSPLRAGGNRSGADAVATWQTGYPAAIDFARGYPRYRPLDGTAARRLDRGEIDALLVVGSVAAIPDEVVSKISGVPCAVLGPRATTGALGAAESAIDTGVAGIHEGGMAVRMDDVPVPLRAAVSGAPSAAVLTANLRHRAIRYRDALRFWHPRRGTSR